MIAEITPQTIWTMNDSINHSLPDQRFSVQPSNLLAFARGMVLTHIGIVPWFPRKINGRLVRPTSAKAHGFPCAYFLYPKICINHLVQRKESTKNAHMV
nr:MAG TPA: hypothetical protein [Caudoviricetes sp.]